MAKTPQPRKEATSVRLEPKIKYLVEFAARIQRRSVTNYIEWALEESLKSVHLNDNLSGFGGTATLDFLKDDLWDISEAKRFATIALHYPDLLTFEEQKLWEVITKHPYLYMKKCPGAWVNDNINFDKLEQDWEVLQHASFDNEEALNSLKEAQKPLIPQRNLNIDEKINEFVKKLVASNTKEEYEKYTKELNDFINSLPSPK